MQRMHLLGSNPRHLAPRRGASWISRCAQFLVARVPEMSEEESMLTAESLWEVSHLVMTPEQAAEFANGKSAIELLRGRAP